MVHRGSIPLRGLEAGGQGRFGATRSQAYREGRLTLSGAAAQAGLTLWEMEQYLIQNGFRSSYSLDDLEEELATLGAKQKGKVKRG